MSTGKSKTVGIITFHRAVNVGSFLQAYAMACLVKNLGFEPEIIDFYSTQQRQQYSKIYLNNNRRKSLKLEVFLAVYSFVLLLTCRRTIRTYKNDHHAFTEKNLPITQVQYKSVDDLKKSQLNYGAYLSGSDQIWNTNAIDFSEAYLLNFAEGAKKVAYAPSLGDSDRLSGQQVNLLKKYAYVSVREKSSAKYLSELLEKDVPYVLDPTFLLKQSSYAKLEQASGIDGDYLFYYGIGYSIKQRIAVNKLARKHGLKVVSWNPQQYALDKLFIRNVVQPKAQNPGVWLDLIKNAKIVVSASFHGSVFSIIYYKDLSIISSKQNNRLAIFNELGLNHKTLQNGNLPKIFKPADVNANRLRELKTSSFNYLKSALGGGVK